MKKLLCAMFLAASISGCYSRVPEVQQPVRPVIKMECSYTNGDRASDVASCSCYDPNKEKLTEQYYKC